MSTLRVGFFFPLSIILWRFIQVVASISGFFFLLTNSPQYKWTAALQSIYLFTCWSNCVISSFWLLQEKFLWTFMYRFWWGHLFSFGLGVYLGEELLGPVLTLCLIIWGSTGLSPNLLYHFTFHQQGMSDLVLWILINFEVVYDFYLRHSDSCILFWLMFPL